MTNPDRMEPAPYAVRISQSAGRLHPEPPHPYRSDFQRDRDRIIHSRRFRRLEYKTQVFVNGTADHYRTRLTHTFEMTAVSRTLARALGANEDLAGCISLAHDIGHSPFGHVGEEALNDLMKDHGGFDHNLQSVRWVEVLERRYPNIDGLNLTWEVRAGLRKHQAHLPDEMLDGRPIGPYQQIEAQIADIADIADDITYQAHDVDDGLDAGLLSENQLAELGLWRLAQEQVERQFGRLNPGDRRLLTVRGLLNVQVEDILDESRTRIAAEVMEAPERMVAFSPEMELLQDETRSFLFKNMYFHPEVADENRASARMMSRLFLFLRRTSRYDGEPGQGADSAGWHSPVGLRLRVGHDRPLCIGTIYRIRSGCAKGRRIRIGWPVWSPSGRSQHDP